jgi:hypothetical protein
MVKLRRRSILLLRKVALGLLIVVGFWSLVLMMFGPSDHDESHERQQIDELMGQMRQTK